MLTGVGGSHAGSCAGQGRSGGRGWASRPSRRSPQPAGPGSPLQRRLALALALAIGLAALFLLALSQSLTSAANSDGAANILQAQAMLHGNPLLRGWWTSDVSFYTTELPEYALVVAARGISPDVVHVCGALTYMLAVALAGLLARGSAAGPAGRRRAGLAVGIMLAPSILGGTEVFLENPDHFGTSVPVLLLLLLLDWWDRPDRHGRPLYRWYVPAAACALLAWTQVGDELSLVAATVPVAAVCAYRLVMLAVARGPRPAAAATARRAERRRAAARGRHRVDRDRQARAVPHHRGRRLRPAADPRRHGSPRSGNSPAMSACSRSRSWCSSAPTTRARRAGRSRDRSTSRSC